MHFLNVGNTNILMKSLVMKVPHLVATCNTMMHFQHLQTVCTFYSALWSFLRLMCST